MALKKARKVVVASKKPTSAAMGVAETPDPLGRGGAHNLSPPRLPPGVYFSPTREESVALLDRWIAGGGKEVPADARGFVSHADIYSDGPGALRRRHPPASARAGHASGGSSARPGSSAPAPRPSAPAAKSTPAGTGGRTGARPRGAGSRATSSSSSAPAPARPGRRRHRGWRRNSPAPRTTAPARRACPRSTCSTSPRAPPTTS
ncbi:hypothetical protein VPH35_066703 [Triticum aestivum]